MHHQPRTDPEIAATVRCELDKIIARGVGPRTAMRRVARRHRMAPRQLGALMAHGGRPIGGDA
jgi:hypothetical protein